MTTKTTGTIKGFIFDLDGVIVFTDKLHYQAWKRMADRLGIAFDETVNNRLRGVSREESLDIILENAHGPALDAEEKRRLAEEKNTYYRELLEELTPDAVEEKVKDTLVKLRQRGFRLAIGSSSKNAGLILDHRAVRRGVGRQQHSALQAGPGGIFEGRRVSGPGTRGLRRDRGRRGGHPGGEGRRNVRRGGPQRGGLPAGGCEPGDL